MAKFEYELEFELREAYGKGASRRLRLLEDKVPAIVYGGEETPQSISMSHRAVSKALENEAVYSHILTLTHQGKRQRVVLKDIQRHPYKKRILHMDFMRINENKPIIMHVPLHFLGQDTAPGVTVEGGTVTHHMVELEIKCLPRHLPEFIEVDISEATLDTVVHLSQIKLPEHVELVTVIHGHENDLPVVSVHKTRGAAAEEEATEAAAEVEASDKKEAKKENNKETGNSTKK